MLFPSVCTKCTGEFLGVLPVMGWFPALCPGQSDAHVCQFRAAQSDQTSCQVRNDRCCKGPCMATSCGLAPMAREAVVIGRPLQL